MDFRREGEATLEIEAGEVPEGEDEEGGEEVLDSTANVWSRTSE